MLEVELKFTVSDIPTARARIKELGAQFDKEQAEFDRYFNAPDRDFARTDEALRLRTIGEKNYLTYKGPKLDSITKSRTEIQLCLEDGHGAAALAVALLTNLGYRFVANISKLRTVYRLKSDGIEVSLCMDQVEGLGTYIEIEALSGEDGPEAASTAVLGLANQMQLTVPVKRSYLELWLQKHNPIITANG